MLMSFNGQIISYVRWLAIILIISISVIEREIDRMSPFIETNLPLTYFADNIWRLLCLSVREVAENKNWTISSAKREEQRV
jgi:hypothetical protein